jgi:hypothetical protein
MARLVLRVRNLQTGSAEEHAFEQSPVRVGRHPRNELPLDVPFVSQWHGLFTFDDAGCAYLDQGSTNGSFLDGQRLVSAQSTPIGPESELRIGVLRVRAEIQTSERASAPQPSHFPGDSDATIRPSSDHGGAEDSCGPTPRFRTEPEMAESSPNLVPPSPPCAAPLPTSAGRRAGWDGDWRALLPPPGTTADEGFLERLSHALERLSSLVDSQCIRDPDLAAALQRVVSEGTGDALIAFLLDPRTPPGERAGEVRSALG